MAIISEKGTIRYRGEIRKGISKSGNEWAFQDIVLEVPTGSSQYKNLLVRADINQIEDLKKVEDRQMIEVNYYVDAREYNGRWYSDVKLFSFKVIGPEQHTGGTPFEKKTYNASPEVKKPAKQPEPVDVEKDLPF